MTITKSHQFDNQVNALIASMTLEEKIAQLGAYWVYDLQSRGTLDPQKMAEKLANGIGQITRNAGACNLYPRETARSANQLQQYLKEHTRLGIPAIIHEECCVGLMSAGSTVYPQIIGLASTFRPELAERMTTDIRQQTRAIGSHQGLAPVLDVSRDPRWGRVEETFGEDPTLVSQFGVAYIHGLQGDDLSNGVMATGKHFVGHSLSQGGLNCAPVQLGMHEIWDVYLAPFQAAIRDAGLASMMNAYPQLDGEVVATSRRILTDLLREKLGFDGLVVSDYEAILMIHNFHYAAESRRAAAVKALNAGIDVELPTVTCYGDELLIALDKGEISLDTIERSVSRHLKKKFELGLFENPFVNEDNVINVFETPANRELAREIADQSLVLLKNDGTLPLKKNISRLAVIGPNADSARSLLGDYSYTATAELLVALPDPNSAFSAMTPEEASTPTVKVVSVLEGIRNCLPPSVQVSYTPGCDVNSTDEGGFEKAVALAQDADAVVMVMGGRSGLLYECTTGEFRDAANLELPGVQGKLIREVVKTGKPVVLVLVDGRPVALADLADHLNAILEAWIPGEEGGNAVAAVLFGDVNPAGRLPLSIPRSAGQLPVFYNHKPSGMHSNIYGNYYDQPTSPLYCFGHGLSYTTFSYESLHIDGSEFLPGSLVNISCTVSNTGSAAGDEVVQLYIRDEYASLPRPLKELKGFTRLYLLPGEERRITFHLDSNQLAFYDDQLNLVLEPGHFLVMVGASSDDIRLEGGFNLSGDQSITVKERVFVCPVTVKE